MEDELLDSRMIDAVGHVVEFGTAVEVREKVIWRLAGGTEGNERRELGCRLCVHFDDTRVAGWRRGLAGGGTS